MNRIYVCKCLRGYCCVLVAAISASLLRWAHQSIRRRPQIFLVFFFPFFSPAPPIRPPSQLFVGRFNLFRTRSPVLGTNNSEGDRFVPKTGDCGPL